MCLIARHLESAGTPTISLTSAYDITTAGNPPRAVFVDYPLGHTSGLAFDPEDQYEIVRSGLGALETIQKPGVVIDLGRRWSDDDRWQAEAMRADRGDTRSARDTTPQWQHPEDRIAAEGTAIAGDAR
ncbi:MAG: hypothetical protein OEU46_06500 [Alphaproteobacteria bacterium]|nr:hypothetical protein [Alphaproteobacteria bacterium]